MYASAASMVIFWLAVRQQWESVTGADHEITHVRQDMLLVTKPIHKSESLGADSASHQVNFIST